MKIVKLNESQLRRLIKETMVSLEDYPELQDFAFEIRERIIDMLRQYPDIDFHHVAGVVDQEVLAMFENIGQAINETSPGRHDGYYDPMEFKR